MGRFKNPITGVTIDQENRSIQDLANQGFVPIADKEDKSEVIPTTPEPTPESERTADLTPTDLGIIPEYEQSPADIERERQAMLAKEAFQDTRTDEEIRTDMEEQFQAEIDSINRIYEEKRAEAERTGEGRIGRTTAIQARRGLLGSTFGESQKRRVEDINQDVLATISAQKQVALAGVYDEIDEDYEAELKKQRMAIEQGGRDYLNYLIGEEARKEERINRSVLGLIREEIDPSDALFADFADRLETSVDNLERIYKTAKDSYDAKVEAGEIEAEREATEFQTDIAKTQAETGKITAETSETLSDIYEGRAETVLERDKFESEEAFKRGQVTLDIAKQELNRDEFESDAEFEREAQKLAEAEFNWRKYIETEQENTNRLKVEAGIAKTMAEIKNMGKEDTIEKQKAELELRKLQEEANSIDIENDRKLLTTGHEIEALDAKLNDLDAIIYGEDAKAAIHDLVGTSWLGRTDPFSGYFESNKRLQGTVAQFVDSSTLDTLINLKARGGTLGAISEKELEILRSAGTKIINWEVRDDNNNGIGKWNTTYELFRAELIKMEDALKRLKEAAEYDEKQLEAEVLETKTEDLF